MSAAGPITGLLLEINCVAHFCRHIGILLQTQWPTSTSGHFYRILSKDCNSYTNTALISRVMWVSYKQNRKAKHHLASQIYHWWPGSKGAWLWKNVKFSYFIRLMNFIANKIKTNDRDHAPHLSPRWQHCPRCCLSSLCCASCWAGSGGCPPASGIKLWWGVNWCWLDN